MTIKDATTIGTALLPQARKWLRRTSTALDEEISQTVAACLLDMNNAGIVRIKGDDPLIQQAVKFYLKAGSGYDDHPERWEAAYERLKAALALSSDYNRPGEE